MSLQWLWQLSKLAFLWADCEKVNEVFQGRHLEQWRAHSKMLINNSYSSGVASNIHLTYMNSTIHIQEREKENKKTFQYYSISAQHSTQRMLPGVTSRWKTGLPFPLTGSLLAQASHKLSGILMCKDGYCLYNYFMWIQQSGSILEEKWLHCKSLVRYLLWGLKHNVGSLKKFLSFNNF